MTDGRSAIEQGPGWGLRVPCSGAGGGLFVVAEMSFIFMRWLCHSWCVCQDSKKNVPLKMGVFYYK